MSERGLKYLITKEALLTMEDGVSIQDLLNIKKVEPENEISLTGKQLFFIAKELKDLGFRVNIKIDDFLREDLNIYDDSYNFDDFLIYIGEDLKDGVKSIQIIKNKYCFIHLFKSGIMFVDIFDNKTYVLKLLEDIKDIVLEVIEYEDEYELSYY